MMISLFLSGQFNQTHIPLTIPYSIDHHVYKKKKVKTLEVFTLLMVMHRNFISQWLLLMKLPA